MIQIQAQCHFCHQPVTAIRQPNGSYLMRLVEQHDYAACQAATAKRSKAA